MNDTVYSVILSPDLDVERAEILNPNGGVIIKYKHNYRHLNLMSGEN